MAPFTEEGVNQHISASPKLNEVSIAQMLFRIKFLNNKWQEINLYSVVHTVKSQFYSLTDIGTFSQMFVFFFFVAAGGAQTPLRLGKACDCCLMKEGNW